MITASTKRLVLAFSICTLFMVQVRSQDINEQLSANKPCVTPEMQSGKPEPGKRVKVIPEGYAGTNVYHSFYLPEGHTADKKYPVIVEYTGNFAPGLGSSGQVKDASLGYATARALGAIWVVMPYLSADGRKSELTWWGSETHTIGYCARQLREICMNYGGDPSAAFIIGFSRGAIAVNRLGLHDDRAADIWLGFHSHDHFDGQLRWSAPWANNGDYEAYKTDAAERAKRYKGRAALVGGEQMDNVAVYLSSSQIDTYGKLTILSVPVAQIIPPGKLFVNPDNGRKITHTDKWMNYDSPEADEVVQWYKNVIKNKPGTYCIHGRITTQNGKPVKGVLVETGMDGVDHKGIYTHFSITDSNGAYKIEGLTGGKRIVIVKDKTGAKLVKSKKVDLQSDEVLNVQTAQAAEDSIEYQMILTDPVFPDSGYSPHTVVLSFDEYGFPDKYKLSLFIDVCVRNTCKPLAVTLFWNALGEYEYLEYPEYLPFTKYDHKEFTPGDYRHLDAILRDRYSILGRHPITYFEEQFARDLAREPARVDAITSATPQAIRDAVVEDAAYTSWTLWHWTNGEIAGLLLDNTRGFCSKDYLLHCLESDNPRFVRFGLSQLTQMDMADPSLREKCFHILEYGGRANCKAAIQIVTTAPDDTIRMHRELVKRIGMNAGSSQLIITYFEDLPVVDPLIWEDLAERIGHISSYYDIFTSLILLEKRAGDSELVRARVAGLINSKHENISQRAREFLE